MDFTRQLDILDPRMLQCSCTIIGAGGIGNPTALCVAKMGFRDITIYDPDVVEAVNVPNQLLYGPHHQGMPKASTTARIVGELTDARPAALEESFDGQRPLEGIVISAVDSMKARQVIWESARYNTLVNLFVDGRLGREVVDIHTIVPFQLEDVEAYEQTLFSDENAAALSCTERGIIYVGFLVAGLIGAQVSLWARQLPYRRRLTHFVKPMTLVGA